MKKQENILSSHSGMKAALLLKQWGNRSVKSDDLRGCLKWKHAYAFPEAKGLLSFDQWYVQGLSWPCALCLLNDSALKWGASSCCLLMYLAWRVGKNVNMKYQVHCWGKMVLSCSSDGRETWLLIIGLVVWCPVSLSNIYIKQNHLSCQEIYQISATYKHIYSICCIFYMGH